MSEFAYSAVLVAVIVAVTQLTRFLPFLVFGVKKQPPKAVLYLGRVLPCAIMGMLVVYCYRNINLMTGDHGLPDLIAGLITVAIHLWRRSMFLSLIVGTVSYIILVNFIF